MPLLLAMALSGLERDQWDSLKEYFDLGAKFFNDVPPPFYNTSPSTSTDHSGSTTPTTSTGESGIATLSSSDETESNASNEDTTTNIDTPLLQIWEAAIEQKNKVTEKCKGKDKEQIYEEKKQSNASPEEEEENDEDIPTPPKISISPHPVLTKLNWYDRDVLDLGGNVRYYNKDSFMNFAEVKQGVKYFFDNRSQMSRLQGAYPPPYRTHRCQKCDFVESIFD